MSKILLHPDNSSKVPGIAPIPGTNNNNHAPWPPQKPSDLFTASYGFPQNLPYPNPAPKVPKPTPVFFTQPYGGGHDALDSSSCYDPLNKKIINADGSGWVPVRMWFAAAILDTGIVKSHADLKAGPIRRYNTNHKPGDIYDRHGHGTAMAGIIAAQGRLKGILPGAGLVSIKITPGSSGHTYWSCITEAFRCIKKYNRWHRRKISVINLSFGADENYADDAQFSREPLWELIHEMEERNIPVVVAAGNYYDAFQVSGAAAHCGLDFPAVNSKVIAVGAAAVDVPNGGGGMFLCKEELAAFGQRPVEDAPSNGRYIAAPGVGIVVCGTDANGYSVMSGSSAAAAAVSGTILLMQEIYASSAKHRGQRPPVALIRKALMEGSMTHSNIKRSDFAMGLPDHYYGSRQFHHLHVKNTVDHFLQLIQ